MKRLLIAFIIIFTPALFVVGCDSSNDPSGPWGTPPIISDLQYSPKTAKVNQGGGQITINGSIFCDKGIGGGEITSGTITVGSESRTFNITNYNPDVSWGIITISLVVPTTQAGTFNFSIYVTSQYLGNSNTLTGTFTIT